MDPRGLIVAAALLTSACASTGAVPRPYPGSPAPGAARVGRASMARAEAGSPGAAAAGLALSLVGTPYRSGGAGPDGFDCSGLVQYVFAQTGTDLARSVGGQLEAGVEVAADEIEAGDLVFFAIGRQGPSHVGIAAGDGTFVHAPSSGGAVRVERLDLPYWSSRFAGARRIIDRAPRGASLPRGTASTGDRAR